MTEQLVLVSSSTASVKDLIPSTDDAPSSLASTPMTELAKVICSFDRLSPERANDDLLNALKAVGKLLGGSKDLPILQEAVDLGVVQSLVAFFTQENDEELQIESCRVLNDIAGGNASNTTKVIDAGVVPVALNIVRNSMAKTDLLADCMR